MINIESIINQPYMVIKKEFNKRTYNGVIKCEYYEENRYFKIGIELWNENESNTYGSVDVHIYVDRFSESGKMGFENLAVPNRISNKGIGTALMETVIELSKIFKAYYCPTKEEIKISGWLSVSDYENGNWNKALPFYQRIGIKNNVDVLFIGKNSRDEYRDWKSYLENEKNNDGSVIFKIKEKQ